MQADYFSDNTVAGTLEDFYNNQQLQQTLATTGGFAGGDPQLSTILGPIIEEVPAVVGSIGAGMTLSKALCGLFPSLCSGSTPLLGTAGQAAPKATLFTGSCPPGRVRRKVAYGRDICAKKPRMNPLNPKALMRATRRLAGFQNFATRTEKAIRHSFVKAGVRAPRRVAGKCGTCSKKSCGGC